MTQTHEPPEPPDRLARPPSERYKPSAPSSAPAQIDEQEAALAVATPGRGVAFGLIGGAIGAALLVLFGAVFAYSVGLLVVAFFLGRIVGYTVRAGALDSLSSSARVSVAVLIALGAITLAQVAIWLWALQEGGTLGLGEYLVDAFGPLVPLEYMLATLTAWWTAR
jgi:hypothetical protein